MIFVKRRKRERFENLDRLAEEATLKDVVKEAAYKIHMAGGCDAVDDYSRGYDDAIAVALDILLEETGFGIEDILDYGERGEI